MEIIKQKIKQLNITDWCLILFFTSRLYTSVFTSVLGHKGVFVSMGVLACAYLAGIIYNVRRKNYYFVSFISLVFFVLLALFTSLFFNPDTKYWVFDHEWGFFIKVFDVRKSIFGFFVILLVTNYKKINKDLEIAAYLNTIYFTIQIALYWIVGNWNNYFQVASENLIDPLYNMSLGYELMFIVVVVALKAWNERSKKDFALAAVVFSMAVIYGPRGVVVIYAAFLLMLFLFKARGKEEKKRALKFIAIMMCSVVVLVGVQNTAISIGNTISLQNAENDSELIEARTSRNVQVFSQGEVTSANGRQDIYRIGLDEIKKGHIFGNGVYGDRPLVGKEYKWGYSHSIIIEMILSFGIFGVAAILFLFIMSFKILLDRESEYQDLMLIFLALSTKLLISDSFWFLNVFWAYLAIIFLYLYKGRTYNVKKHIIGLAVFCLGSIMVMTVFFKQDIKSQDFKVIEFDQPTALIVMDCGGSPDQAVNTRYALERGAVVTSCLRGSDLILPGHLGKNQIELLKEKGVDFQDAGYTGTNFKRLRYPGIQDECKQSDYLFERYGLTKPNMIVPPYGVTNRSVTYNLKEDRRFVVLYETNYGRCSYRSLNASEALNMDAAILNADAAEDINSLLDAVKDASKKNELFVLVVKNEDTQEDRDIVQTEFKKVLQVMKEENYDFITTKQLNEKSLCEDKDKTIGNYLKNSSIYNYLH